MQNTPENTKPATGRHLRESSITWKSKDLTCTARCSEARESSCNEPPKPQKLFTGGINTRPTPIFRYETKCFGTPYEKRKSHQVIFEKIKKFKENQETTETPLDVQMNKIKVKISGDKSKEKERNMTIEEKIELMTKKKAVEAGIMYHARRRNRNVMASRDNDFSRESTPPLSPFNYSEFDSSEERPQTPRGRSHGLNTTGPAPRSPMLNATGPVRHATPSRVRRSSHDPNIPGPSHGRNASIPTRLKFTQSYDTPKSVGQSRNKSPAGTTGRSFNLTGSPKKQDKTGTSRYGLSILPIRRVSDLNAESMWRYERDPNRQLIKRQKHNVPLRDRLYQVVITPSSLDRLDFNPNKIYNVGERGSGYHYLGNVQNFYDLREECFDNGKLFEDPLFPCDLTMLKSPANLNKSHYIDEVEWMRPVEIDEDCDPKFFVKQISRFGIKQGALADCWFLAALANLTMNPDLFRQVVPFDQSLEHNYCGIFHFRFWRGGRWIDICIDDRLPTIDDHLVYATSGNSKEYWVPLIEKAYAKLHGGYFAIRGGCPSDALQELTGGVIFAIDISRERRETELFHTMYSAFMKGAMLSSSIFIPEDKAAEEETEQEKQDREEPVTAEGLAVGHAYTITKVEFVNYTQPDGTPMVVSLLRIRNPWGDQKKWVGAWSDWSPEWKMVSEKEKKRIRLKFGEHGEFWMSFYDFCARFSVLIFNHLNPSSVDKYQHFQVHMHTGAWIRGVCAGGDARFGNFHTNPQFKFYLAEPDENDDMCYVVINLTATRQRSMYIEDSLMCFELYYLAPLLEGQVHPVPLDQRHINPLFHLGGSGMYEERTCTNHFMLTPEYTYVVVPTKFEAEEEGEFLLRIFTEKNCHLESIDSSVGYISPPEAERDCMCYEGTQPAADTFEYHRVIPDMSMNSNMSWHFRADDPENRQFKPPPAYRYVPDATLQSGFGGAPLDVTGPALNVTGNVTGPALNATGPGLNATAPVLNATGPGLNATGPGLNATGSGLNATGPCLNATKSGLNVTGPGLNATGPGVNATRPGLNATGPRVNTTRSGLNVTGPDPNMSHPTDSSPRLSGKSKSSSPSIAQTPERRSEQPSSGVASATPKTPETPKSFAPTTPLATSSPNQASIRIEKPDGSILVGTQNQDGSITIEKYKAHSPTQVLFISKENKDGSYLIELDDPNVKSLTIAKKLTEDSYMIGKKTPAGSITFPRIVDLNQLDRSKELFQVTSFNGDASFNLKRAKQRWQLERGKRVDTKLQKERAWNPYLEDPILVKENVQEEVSDPDDMTFKQSLNREAEFVIIKKNKDGTYTSQARQVDGHFSVNWEHVNLPQLFAISQQHDDESFSVKVKKVSKKFNKSHADRSDKSILIVPETEENSLAPRLSFGTDNGSLMDVRNYKLGPIEWYFHDKFPESEQINWKQLKKLIKYFFKEVCFYKGFTDDVCRALVAMYDVDYSGMLSVDEVADLGKDLKLWTHCFYKNDTKHENKLKASAIKKVFTEAGFSINLKVLGLVLKRYGTLDYLMYEDFLLAAIKLKHCIHLFNKLKDGEDSVDLTISREEYINFMVYS